MGDPPGQRKKHARPGLDEPEKRVPLEQGGEDGNVVHDANVPEVRLLALDHAVEVAAVLEERVMLMTKVTPSALAEFCNRSAVNIVRSRD